ncbi:transcriptional regulator [Tissierella sp. P1]|uniref:helix-turn-helix domain-containing protein n=1 Tax=Tissierella sp. P1 TaxID=1280483 RepID=UPI000BA12135|nr:helix-turn-helix domain-containing protein [Tissierella sp. P1]OZV10753.1 transcriptional regulator [Tissierella sp. P1]
MQNYSDFGVEVRGVMLKKGITMTSLAKELGISVTYLSDILRGTRKGAKQRKRIVQALGMEQAS